MWSEFEHDLELSESNVGSCMIDEEGVEVVIKGVEKNSNAR